MPEEQVGVTASVCLALAVMRNFTAVGQGAEWALVLYLLSLNIPVGFSLKIIFLMHTAELQATLR